MSNPMSDSFQGLFTIADFARAIGKTERQVYRYIHQGRIEVLPPEKSGLSGIRIPRAELEKLQGRYKPSVQIVMSDSPSVTSDKGSDNESVMSKQVPLERHEAALFRLGSLEKELDMTRKMLTDGGTQVSDLTSKVQTLQLEVAKSEARLEMQEKYRQESEKKTEELAVQLADAQAKLNKRWWKRW